VLWQQNRNLALSLRDQGLADCLAARFTLRPVELRLFQQPVTFAHPTVSMSQQAVEKLTKGYLLWHFQSFDPTKGHAPFATLLEDQPPQQRRALERLIQALDRLNGSIVREIKWLESLAPKLPAVPEAERGNLQPLHILPENAEYPFWSPAGRVLVTPARGITLLGHGVRAFKAVRTYLTALAQSNPPGYCLAIREFLESFPMSTEVTEWPQGAYG
jgi:hypothetical protein